MLRNQGKVGLGVEIPTLGAGWDCGRGRSISVGEV